MILKKVIKYENVTHGKNVMPLLDQMHKYQKILKYFPKSLF